MSSTLTCKATAFKSGDLKGDTVHDVVIYINDGIAPRHFPSNCSTDNQIHQAIIEFAKVNKNLAKEVTVLPFATHPSGRLVYAPVASLNGDTDDARLISEAAFAGMKKALSLDCVKPLLLVGAMSTAPKDARWAQEPMLTVNAMLGAYHALYVPIELREAFPDKARRIQALGVRVRDESLLDIVYALEEGRRVARDIAGSDPERMSAPSISQYIEEEFAQHKDCIKLTSEKVDGKKYPLMEAVNRAAETVPRHSGRVIKLEYEAGGEEDLYLVGKGITYDTGGADVKAGGVMAGMHRDKGGAAGVAGFMKMLAMLKPKGISVHGRMAYVRNSIGESCYVADEIITARSGKRIRVGNTDAEGRMVMADLLCEAKEEALSKPNPFLFTWATLTGHVGRAYGGYTAVMDNGPARLKGVSTDLRDAGDLISDLTEVSTVRREDFEAHKGKSEYEDVLQANNLPSTNTPRGHQTPAAFLTMASGLDKHGRDSQNPLPFTHVDVAFSAGLINTLPTGSPSLMFAAKYILPRILK